MMSSDQSRQDFLKRNTVAGLALALSPDPWTARVGAMATPQMHNTAPTEFVEANGIGFVYRRFGKANVVPLLFMQHFRGGMDHWDPAVTDGFAADRPVILFDNAGVASSRPDTHNG